MIVLVVGMAACSEEPAAPDAMPPPDAAVVEPDWPAGGLYALDWTCLEGCAADLPAAYNDRLHVEETRLVYWYRECVSCTAIDVITERAEDCIAGAGIPQGDGAKPTGPYRLCADGGEIEGVVEYQGYPGPPSLRRAWRVRLTPL